jgi:hypothetical protein
VLDPAFLEPATTSEEPTMPDDRSQRGGPDRSRVAGEEQYEVRHFAERHGLSMDEARRIIEEAGPSREKADAAAERAKGR